MSSAPSFAELLDAALAAQADVRMGPAEIRDTVTMPAPEPFPFFGCFRVPEPAAAAVSSAQPSTRVAPHRWTAPPRVRTHLSRQLTAEQQTALSALVGLGARLDERFTPRDLRSAFRSLALRYHPDRHPDSTPAELARLTALFATISTHHRCLLAASAHPPRQ
jgi:hypothetical protein